MGKASPQEKSVGKRVKERRSYLKPGAIAQLRSEKSSNGRCCRNSRKRRVDTLNSRKTERSGNEKNDASPLMLSPVDLAKPNYLSASPKTPTFEKCESKSLTEILPMHLLVKIMCHLHHDQLKAVFHVCRKFREAAVDARQSHFNYTTPDRSRQEQLSRTTPCSSDRWPFLCKGDGKGLKISSPRTPKAPRHGPRPPSRLKVSEMRQVAVVLFKESAFPSRYMVPSVLPKPLSKSLASNRVLLYEDELCQAVAQNKLR